MKNKSIYSERTDDVWGETIIIEPKFKVLGKEVSLIISENYLSLWIDGVTTRTNGECLEIKNLKELLKRKE